MRRARRPGPIVAAVLVAACAMESPSPSPSAPQTPSPTAEPSPSAPPSASPTGSPTPTPEPSLSLDPPASSDPRVVAATVVPEVAEAGGTVTVTVTSLAEERIDELVLRWPLELDSSLRMAPFTPSEERIREGGAPLVQPWTKWVIGPGEQGEPAGTISVGWGPLLPGATLEIPLAATRSAPGALAFDLQLLSGNDLLTFEGGAPAELRIEVP